MDWGHPKSSLNFANSLSHLSVMLPETKLYGSANPLVNSALLGATATASSPAAQHRPRGQTRHVLSAILSWSISPVGCRVEICVTWVNWGAKSHQFSLALPNVSAPKYPSTTFFSKTTWSYFDFTSKRRLPQINGQFCIALTFTQSNKRSCMYKLGKKFGAVS